MRLFTPLALLAPFLWSTLGRPEASEPFAKSTFKQKWSVSTPQGPVTFASDGRQFCFNNARGRPWSIVKESIVIAKSTNGGCVERIFSQEYHDFGMALWANKPNVDTEFVIDIEAIPVINWVQVSAL
ncbi:uncharacterized protein PFL1_05342 [Pseudozyma flocculosa PF-1]|uniref:Uncharacterized protein n=2 Tax=Pseudozyma flocculosa TaxID=84751 RepID=A0A5C3FDB0_9BASI|nr:uncharacterized protein PFL1_05342 [Pseudozyma flocculosa PF-1]EPQ27058.1 hypothetical protein PFL1_05342 [Pseudozyma flocculosa PF-1]SPO42136.1 uncharacterized protein PSFLO_07619 [Pseudozyma flocculosa]